MKYPVFILVEDVTPRSHKRSFFIAKLRPDFDYPRYEMWCKCDNEREAIDRTNELNSAFHGGILSPTDHIHDKGIVYDLRSQYPKKDNN
jgi:hypothetical protein